MGGSSWGCISSSSGSSPGFSVIRTRVVFSRNAYSGRLKVIRVIYNPNEMK